MADLLVPLADRRSIGFSGLGGLAWDMAACLARAGHALTVHDEEADRADRFAKDFACRAVRSLAELATLGLVLMAPQAAAREAQIERLAELGRPGAIVIDLGEGDPSRTRSLGALLAQRGIALIDAPLCGAEGDPGERAICHGSDDESAIEQALPVLKALGLPVLTAGALGGGHALRLLEIHVRAATIAAASEALLVASRLGLEGASLRMRLAATTGRAFDAASMQRELSGAPAFSAGLALGLLAGAHDNTQADLHDFAGRRAAPGLTRLLIEFTTPVTPHHNTQETL